MSDSSSESQNGGSKNGSVVQVLALTVVGCSFVAIVALAVVAIYYATARDETTRLVFVSVLPLFGTWVGTVLAYYFARENLKEATASVEASVKATSQLVAAWTPATLVKDAMTPASKVENYVLQTSGTPPAKLEDVKLTDLWTRLNERPFDRLPIVDENKIVRGLVSRQDLSDFAALQAATIDDAFANRTIHDLKSTPEELAKLLHKFVTAAPEMTLGAASERLAREPDAQTVIVTTDGTDNTALEGILSSTDIITNMKG